MDYDLALFVANWPAPRRQPWRTLLRARAIENLSYVIGVNRVGVDGNDHPYAGDSGVIDPVGEPLVELGTHVGRRGLCLLLRVLDGLGDLLAESHLSSPSR
jgi:predicted amidohydrolase